MLSTDQWATIRGLVDWLDQNNGRSDHELAMRTLKVTEEAGEVAAAYIGVHGQNPRKGRSHGWVDVQEELCDVIVTAAVALASISAEPQGVLDAKLTKIAARSAVAR
ncbi:MazG-like family protein [Streptomyces sp. NPDC020747]|uniref:MazG-like family protein n=1 Tax=Streptomyces sp. NPDC020747 TaxID=3365086 RepID=UPI0037B5A750